MVRDFKALVRINDWEVDQKRRALAVELQKLETLIDLLQRLEDEIVHEQEQAATMPTGRRYDVWGICRHRHCAP